MTIKNYVGSEEGKEGPRKGMVVPLSVQQI